MRDKWREIEAEVLGLLLEVSWGLQNIESVVACALRLIDTHMPFPASKKKTLQVSRGLHVHLDGI